MPPLTEAKIRAAAPTAKPRKLADGGGLYLEVMPTGAKYWRVKYRHQEREKRLALGVYPEITLAMARAGRERARAQIRAGVDPSAAKQAERRVAAGVVSFEGVAREWLAKQGKRLAASTLKKKVWIFEDHVFPWLGRANVAQISSPDMLSVVQRLEKRGALETAHRTKQQCSEIFRYAIATGRATSDPTVALKGALAPVVTRSHAAVTEPKAVGELLRALDAYLGQPATCAALRLAPLVWVRPGELRQAEWSEIDLDAKQWVIPAGKMKMRLEHLVPLSRQAVEILRDLKPLTGRGNYVFPAMTRKGRPLSENTINAALRSLGYANDTMTGHGFRAMASTLLNEKGFRTEVIERQLAHKERDKVRAVYNRAQYLPERRKMMQAWADYLDKLRRP